MTQSWWHTGWCRHHLIQVTMRSNYYQGFCRVVTTFSQQRGTRFLSGILP